MPIPQVFRTIRAPSLDETTQRLMIRASCGLSVEEARHRSLLLYAYIFGQSLMSGECFEPRPDESRQWIAERILS